MGERSNNESKQKEICKMKLQDCFRGHIIALHAYDRKKIKV